MIAVLLILLALLAAPFVGEALRRPMSAEARRQAEGKFVTLSLGVTHYDWIGPADAPVAVCVHGLTTPCFVWRGIAQGLVAMGYRVLIYDLYGRGYSDRPRGPQDRAFFLGQLDDLLASQNVTGPITLLGYSMGGRIAAAWAADNPDRIQQLILIASAGVMVAPGRLATFIRGTPIFGDWLMYAFFPRNHRKETELERDLPSSVDNIVDRQQEELHYRGFVPAVLRSFRGILSSTAEADHRALGAAGVPVLAIWGGDDPLIPKSSAGRVAEWNHDVRQEVIDNAGHGVTYTHTPEVLATIREHSV
ncbi:MAG: alpha/beta fold hydrolase [Paracoccaceae bacterium]